MNVRAFATLLALSAPTFTACTIVTPDPTNQWPTTEDPVVGVSSSSSSSSSGTVTHAKSCDAGARQDNGDGIQLQVPELLQQCTEWCWAATISMVAGYFGKNTQECSLASAKTGNACCSDVACGTTECNVPAQTTEISAILSSLGVHGSYQGSPLGEDALANELDHGRPVIVGYQGPFSGHVAVISGYQVTPSGRLFHVADPWPQFGSFDAPYATIANGPQEPWVDTWSGLTTSTSCASD